MGILQKLKMELPYDPVIPFLGIYPDKTIIQKDICTCYVHSNTIAKAWKQAECPLTDGWIKKIHKIFHGLRNLAGYSPWGRKESDTTVRVRQTHTHTHTHTHNGILVSQLKRTK